MSDESITTDDVLPCGCGSVPVCEHHLRLGEYATAFRGDPPVASDLPDLVLQASFTTWLSEVDRFRKTLFVVLVIGFPLVVSIVGRNVLFGVAVFSMFAVPIAVLLLTIPNNRLILDPRAKAVTFRNWRRKSVVLQVDDQMRAAAFQYLDVGVTQSAITVVLWRPDGIARMDQRAWGYGQLEDLIVVLGVPVGGIAGDEDIEAAFPGSLSPLAKHPARSAFGIVTVGVVVFIAAAAVFGRSAETDEPTKREPTVAEVNGPKPSAMPPDVAVRQDSLDTALQQVVGLTEWSEESRIHTCPEQEGWQREVTYRSVSGGNAPDLVAQVTAAVEEDEQGLVVDRAEASGGTLIISTAYGSETGADARLYVYAYRASGEFGQVSITTNSECVVTR